MAQISEIDIPEGLAAQSSAYSDMDEAERREHAAYMAALSQANNPTLFAENALFLYFEQRRRTRTYAIGCAVAAMALGGIFGFYVGKPSK